MKVNCYIHIAKERKLVQNQMELFVKWITEIELFGLNDRVIEEARSKVKKTEEAKHKV